jgi:hypothetical protein
MLPPLSRRSPQRSRLTDGRSNPARLIPATPRLGQGGGRQQRRGVRRSFGAFAEEIARGLAIRHDHGSQYMSDAFQQELAFLGIESTPAFVRAPRGTAVPSASSARSRRTCSGCGPSTASKSFVRRYWPSEKPTTRPGSSNGTGFEPPRPSGRASFHLAAHSSAKLPSTAVAVRRSGWPQNRQM